MTKINRAIGIILLILCLTAVLSGCGRVPKDDIEVNVVTVEKTYLRDEDATELFFLLDVNNGKNRTIDKMEIDVLIEYRDGTVKNHTIVYEESLSYYGTSPAIFRYTVDGRAEGIEILDYRFELLDYWGTFGSLIISAVVIYIVLAIVMVMLAMAEMETPLSILAGLIVIFCVIFFIIQVSPSQ